VRTIEITIAMATDANTQPVINAISFHVGIT
jgi:hypothetical protein